MMFIKLYFHAKMIGLDVAFEKVHDPPLVVVGAG